MRRQGALRALAVVALAVPAALTSWVMAAPASAVTAPTCAAVSGPNGLKWTLSKCTDPSHTGSKGSAVTKFGNGTGTMKITWNKTGTTTLTFTYSFVTASACANGQVEIKELGKVTGGSGAALKTIPKGQKTSVAVCQGATSVALVKGTKFVL